MSLSRIFRVFGKLNNYKEKNTTMRNLSLILQICLSFLFTVKAQESKRIVEDFHEEEITFLSDWWKNPAMRFAYPLQQFTDVSVNFLKKDAKAFAIQEGADTHKFEFRSNSFFKDTKQLYYGSANYSKWNIEGYKWNTIADINLLQPYIIADTIGGKMYNEQYFFSGGYARRFSRIGVGAFASYRAKTAYKKIDPRPNNTVSDLKVRLGTAWKMSSNYTLGGAIDFNKYQQDQSMSVYKDGGGAKIYYLRGLGVADERFSTVITDRSGVGNKYKQNDYGLTLSFFPSQQRGFLSMISFSNANLELLKQRGRTQMSVNELKTNLAKTSLGYKFTMKEVGCLVKLYGQYREQKGKEFIYKQNLTLLTTTEKYKNTEYRAGVEALGRYQWKNISSLTTLNIAYCNQEERYAGVRNSTSNAKNVGNIVLKLQENLLWSFEKSTLLTKFGIGYRHNLRKDLKTGTLTADRARETLVMPDYLFDTSNYILGNFTLRYDYKLTEKYAIYGKGICQYANYQDLGNRQHYQFSVGLAF